MCIVIKGRGRGRPQGSSRYSEQDVALLRQAADFLISDETLSVTAAIKKATGRLDDETLTHRLRRKIKSSEEQYRREARERAQQGRRTLDQESASRSIDFEKNLVAQAVAQMRKRTEDLVIAYGLCPTLVKKRAMQKIFLTWSGD